MLAYCDPATNNGSDVCPAIITRVWTDEMVNLRLIPDSSAPLASRTSVKLCGDEDAAKAYIANVGHPSGLAPNVAYWPTIVR